MFELMTLEQVRAQLMRREEWLIAAMRAITDGDRYASLPADLRDWWITREDVEHGHSD